MRLEVEREKKQPLISVVVAVFNGVETIEHLLKSVIGCTYDNLDLIIIDGGSSDGTLELLEKYSAHIKYWKSEKDRGIYDALNKAISACEVGSYVLVLGADDKLLELKPLVDSILEFDADVFVTNVQQRNIKNGKISPYKCFLPRVVNSRNFLSFPFHHQGFVFRLSDSASQRFEPELGLHADYEFMVRTIRLSEKSVFVEVLLSEYSTGGASDYFSWTNFKSLSDVAKSLGFNRLSIVLFSPLKFLRMLFKLILPVRFIDFWRDFFRS